MPVTRLSDMEASLVPPINDADVEKLKIGDHVLITIFRDHLSATDGTEVFRP